MKLNVQIMLHYSLLQIDSHDRSLAVHRTRFRAFKLAGSFPSATHSCFGARPEHVIDVIHSPPFPRATETAANRTRHVLGQYRHNDRRFIITFRWFPGPTSAVSPSSSVPSPRDVCGMPLLPTSSSCWSLVATNAP